VVTAPSIVSSTSRTPAPADARWLRVGVAAVWLITAFTMLHPYYREVGEQYLGMVGLPAWPMWATNALELGIAVWVLSGPMSRLLAGMQIAMVSGFTLILAVADPMLIVSPFGVLTKNIPFVAAVAVAYLLDSEGWTPRATRLLQWGMAIIWITEGLFPKILFQQAVELDMVPAMGIPGPPWLFVGALGVAQLLSGIAALTLPRRPRAWLLLAEAIALVALPVLVGFLAPHLWVHPFGPFSKNLPIFAGTYLLYRRWSHSS
jgi:hypothetical protein